MIVFALGMEPYGGVGALFCLGCCKKSDLREPAPAFKNTFMKVRPKLAGKRPDN